MSRVEPSLPEGWHSSRPGHVEHASCGTRSWDVMLAPDGYVHLELRPLGLDHGHVGFTGFGDDEGDPIATLVARYAALHDRIAGLGTAPTVADVELAIEWCRWALATPPEEPRHGEEGRS